MASLAAVAVPRGIVPRIAHSTVSLILERASPILWYYERLEDLDRRGELLICFDEKPNLQALECCCPKQPMQAGQIERQEFEYIRHGTVNFAAALLANDGQMRGWCLEKNDSQHLCPVLEQLFCRALSEARRLEEPVPFDGTPASSLA
jgi:hypothetical protein